MKPSILATILGCVLRDVYSEMLYSGMCTQGNVENNPKT